MYIGSDKYKCGQFDKDVWYDNNTGLPIVSVDGMLL